MSSVPFRIIPSALRLPGALFELDNSQANTSSGGAQRTLIVGQMLSSGIATPNVPIISGGVGDAQNQFGASSQLANMVSMYRNNDAFGEVWCLPVSDGVGSAAATGSIAFSAPPSAAGVIALYIAGTVVNVPVTAGQATASIATAVAAAINAIAMMPVTASVNASTVTLTADNKGLCGNEIDIRLNYYGTSAGEATPTGLTYAITALSGGAVNPSLTTALGNLGNTTFDFIVSPYTDTPTLTSLQQFLNDQTGRWSWMQQLYGHVFSAYAGTYGGLTTFGSGLNDQHKCVMGFYGSPTPSWLWASAIAGQVAVSVRADPGVPVQYLPLVGVLAPPLANQLIKNQRQALLFDGISTFIVEADGTVQIENLITTYQTNAAGVPDNSYLEIETMFQLMLEIRVLEADFLSKFGRCKLTSDESRPAPGSGLVAPKTIWSNIVALYQERERLGFVQNSAEFAKKLVVQQNATNPNRVDILWPGTPVNQMRTFATLVQFRLA